MSDGSELIQRARDLAPMLVEACDEIERRRELPEHVVSALIKGGFFRMLQPRFLGGAELRPVIFTQVTEALAQAYGWFTEGFRLRDLVDARAFLVRAEMT